MSEIFRIFVANQTETMIMKKISAVALFLIISIIGTERIKSENSESTSQMNIFRTEFEIKKVNEVGHRLASEEFSRRTKSDIDKIQEMFICIYPVIEKYSNDYNISEKELMDMVILLFIYESGDSKGRLGKNTLFVNGFNGFGIKYKKNKRGWKAQHKWTREEVFGVDIPEYAKFMKFDNFAESVDCLLGYVLAADRYKEVRESDDVEEFIYELYECGYMTDSKRARQSLYTYEKLF